MMDSKERMPTKNHLCQNKRYLISLQQVVEIIFVSRVTE